MGFGPPGFLHAPASKATTACVFLASLLVHTEHLSASRVSLTPRAVFGVGAHGRQLFSRLVLSNLAFASKGETAVGLALWYRLARDAERKRGTDRYAAFLFVVAAVAVAAQTAAMALFGEKNQKLSPFASGPHALVWAHLPGFALDVPATWHAEFELGGDGKSRANPRHTSRSFSSRASRSRHRQTRPVVDRICTGRSSLR